MAVVSITRLVPFSCCAKHWFCCWFRVMFDYFKCFIVIAQPLMIPFTPSLTSVLSHALTLAAPHTPTRADPCVDPSADPSADPYSDPCSIPLLRFCTLTSLFSGQTRAPGYGCCPGDLCSGGSVAAARSSCRASQPLYAASGTSAPPPTCGPTGIEPSWRSLHTG